MLFGYVVLVSYFSYALSREVSLGGAKAVHDGKALAVPLTDDGTVQLLQHWTNQAFSGLLAAVAMKKNKGLTAQEQQAFQACSKDATDVNKHARCVSRLLRAEFPVRTKNAQFGENFLKYPSSSTKISTPENHRTTIETTLQTLHHRINAFPQPIAKSMPKAFVQADSSSLEMVAKNYVETAKISPVILPKRRKHFFDGVRRLKMPYSLPNTLRRRNPLASVPSIASGRPKTSRFAKYALRRRLRRNTDFIGGKPLHVISRNGYNLQNADGMVSPFGTVAKILKKSMLAEKNKTTPGNWRAAVQRIRNVAKKRRDYDLEQLKPADDDSEQDALEKFAFRGLRREGIDIEKVLEDPKELRRLAQRERKGPGRQQPMRKILDLLRDGLKLGYNIAGQNSSSLDDKTLKVISPRFLSVVPEESPEETENLLSPSLFSLHNEGRGVENLTSLPSLVHGFTAADQQEWLNLIVEAAGVDEQAEKLEKDLVEAQKAKAQKRRASYEERTRTEQGQPLYFTKQNVSEMYGNFETRKIATWERLVASYTPTQLREMNETGYAVLTREQLHFLYGPQSPFNCSEALARLTGVGNVTRMHEHIEDDIHKMAEMRNFEIRQRDIVLSPIITSPLVLAYPAMNTFIVLSPVVLSPVVLTPAVLGPVILSPWVFVPVILSPRVLSPLILNPLIFSPIVLSPLVLHPLILSPGVFNPIVLSPLVLSPFILSPQVFTPVILSPLVLNPLILNPMVGSPLVLSPFVLSPLILSPQALFAVVLSPYALSPLVASKLFLAEVILSPSWLS